MNDTQNPQLKVGRPSRLRIREKDIDDLNRSRILIFFKRKIKTNDVTSMIYIYVQKVIYIYVSLVQSQYDVHWLIEVKREKSMCSFLEH